MNAVSNPFVTVTLNPAWDTTWTIDGPLMPGAVHAVRSETVTPGGKGINVAKILAANGKPVVAGGLLGAADADRFQDRVSVQGIEARFLRVPGRVRTNLMISGSGAEMKFNQAGYPDVAFDAARIRAYIEALATDAGVLIFSGSLPARFPPDTYARMIAAVSRAGVAVVLDAAGEALRQGAAAAPDVIKPNRHELQDLLGETIPTDAALERAMHRLRARHAVVMVSDGPRGAWFAAGKTIRHGTSPDVVRVDTTGAGDAMLGQFCADYFPRRHLSDAVVARALAAGAAAVEQPGTPMLSLARIRELAARVSVRRKAGS